MVLVTVSGHPGSGTSTLVNGLCERFSWTKLNGGEVFRMVAEERGLSLEEFSRQCDEEPEIDIDLDERLRHSMRDLGGPEIIESRLAGLWAYRMDLDCVRVWLRVSTDERAKRVVNREGGDIKDAAARIEERELADQLRYSNLYQFDLDDLSPYTLIIDADSLDSREVQECVIEELTRREVI